MDKVPVFGTGDVGSIPTKGTRTKVALSLQELCGVGTRDGGSPPAGGPPRAHSLRGRTKGSQVRVLPSAPTN